MSSTPPDYARWLAEPSIVIDPELLSDMPPRRTSFGQLMLRVTFTTVRTAACAGVLGVTLFSVAHADKWFSRGHNSAHAAETSNLYAAAEVTPVVTQGIDGPLPSQAADSQERSDTQVVAERAELAPAPANDDSQPAAVTAQAQAADAADAEPAQPAEDDVEKLLHDALRAGRRALAQNRLDDSEAAYGSVLAQRARHPGALAGLARVSVARGDLDTALKFATQAVHFAPAHAVYHATLADVLRARGETSGADLEYETAARLSKKPLDRAAKMLPENPF